MQFKVRALPDQHESATLSIAGSRGPQSSLTQKNENRHYIFEYSTLATILGIKYALHIQDFRAPPNKLCMPTFPCER